MEPDQDHNDYRPPPPSRTPALLTGLIVLALVAVGGYFAWQHFRPMPAPEAAPVAAAPAEPAPAPAPAPAAPATPAIEHPVDAPDAEGKAEPLPALADAGPRVNQMLQSLLGRQNVLTFLQLDHFVSHTVATVDNLARSQAPVAVWPVNPTRDRFSTLRKGGSGEEVIHPDNSRRYQALVGMVEAVDAAQAVKLYRTLYPLFQQAYEELGFPGRYFNDRLVQVIDHLIATPVPAQAPAVHLVDVKGSVPSLRPWVRYEFVDPALQSMSAGRKILIRVGPDNQRRLQAKLAEVRRLLVKS